MKSTILLTALFLSAAAGCQNYSTLTLDLDAYDQVIAQRDIGSESVAAYAAKLRQLNGNGADPGDGRFDPSNGLSLHEAEAVALMFNPQLRAARLAAKVPLARAQESGRWEDPELDFDLLRFTRGGSDPWIAGTALKFTIPISGRLPLEKSVAYGQAVNTWRQVLADEWHLIIDLRKTWLRWSQSQQRIALVTAHLKELDAIIELARKQRQFNRISVTDLRVLELDRISKRGDLESLRATALNQRMQIKAMLGLKSDVQVQLTPAMPTAATLPKAAERTRQLRERNVGLAMAQAAFDVTDRALRLEVRKQYPDLVIGPALENEEGASRVGVAFSVPLPILNANRQGIAEAVAARLAAKAVYEARYEQVSSELDRAIIVVQAAQARQHFLQEQVAPLVDQQLTDLRKLASLGDLDVVVLLDAVTRRFEAKHDVLQAQSDEANGVNKVNALLRPLLTPTAQDQPKTENESVNTGH